MARQTKSPVWSRILWMAVLAAGLAFTEASVVVYLREVLVPLRAERFPNAVREALPLPSREDLRGDSERDDLTRLLYTEVAREVTPLLVLLAAAVGFRRRRGEGVGFFLLGFAAWDILYYVSLKVLMDWPASLGTWDVLYLIPVAWVAPVWAPLAVSATLLVGGWIIVYRPERRISLKGRVVAGLAMLAGAALVLGSFVVRRHEAIGGVPAAFDWPWFLAGWVLGTVGLLWTATRPSASGP